MTTVNIPVILLRVLAVRHVEAASPIASFDSELQTCKTRHQSSFPFLFDAELRWSMRRQNKYVRASLLTSVTIQHAICKFHLRVSLPQLFLNITPKLIPHAHRLATLCTHDRRSRFVGLLQRSTRVTSTSECHEHSSHHGCLIVTAVSMDQACVVCQLMFVNIHTIGFNLFFWWPIIDHLKRHLGCSPFPCCLRVF
ncbi:hypothetical protein PISMIDRAFT_409855 [Pisolithus microcarpus 441]|uniref:Secreted protein n=1 Tax=Pisolithus microcarpus 441 TaxID=765257 RepID=A0A0C9ZEU8_9AGAM|nr:hypothetical protein BKA83DRAFT_1742700 [Pisolithus microcarpus]KAI6037121.1 hypothetical protein BKA83DRAFT_409855 [Pisolithus microcarpus]KIK24444.1 hypothetical protein PISMIDRAFT_409855 [Pisolithus microcarpus 441]